MHATSTANSKGSSAALAFPPLESYLPQMPRFPTVQELADQDRMTSILPATKTDTGLFSTLLCSNLDALYQDSLIHPEKYQEETRDLLTSLVTENRQPTDAERKTLDLAVIDFAQAVPQKPLAAQPSHSPSTPVDPVSPHDEEVLPDVEPEPFWWADT